MRNTEISIHIPPLMWQKIRQSMLDARTHHEETIGFLFCECQRLSADRIRYLPQAWVVPAPDCYELQSASGLILKQDFHHYLLDKFIANRQLNVVHLHTHAGADFPTFSHVDDRAESEYSRFLTSEFSSQPRLISGVFDESLQHGHFRRWNSEGTAVEPVTCYNSWLGIPPLDSAHFCEGRRYANGYATSTSLSTSQCKSLTDPNQTDYHTASLDLDSSPWLSSAVEMNGEPLEIARPASAPDLMFARQTIFGETAQHQLGQLTIALVGCGGIGSIFAETLGRLGVKNWILVDPDRLEHLNLNRMPAATAQMVEEGWYKVDYINHLIHQIYPTEARVRAIPDALVQPPGTGIATTASEIATADLIVVATDNHSSRQIAQEIALKYLRPLVCLGTHIDVKPDGTPRMYARVTVPPLGGGWCLMCGNIINLQRAALESAPVEIDRLVTSAGYLEGVNDPAVFWLNGICASTGVGVIHGIVSGFVNVDAGIDWIYEFPSSEWRKTNTEHLHGDDCYFCSPT
jgi:molybdopterin-synthase adenylyltransferase